MSVPAPLPAVIVLPVRVRGMKLLVPSGPGHSLDFVRREAQAISRAENVIGEAETLRTLLVRDSTGELAFLPSSTSAAVVHTLMQTPGSCLVGVTSKAEEVLLRSLPPTANVAPAVPHHQALALSAPPSAPASALAPSAHNGLQVAQGMPVMTPPPPTGLPAQYPLPPAEAAGADERGASPAGRGGRGGGGRGRGRRGRPPGPGRGCVGRGRSRVDTTERQAASGRPTQIVEDQLKRKRPASDDEEEEEEDGDDTDSELYTGRGGRGRRGRGRGRGRGRKAVEREGSPDSDVDSQQPAARGRGRGRRGRGRVGRAPGRGRGRGRSAALTSVEEVPYAAPPSAAPTAPAVVPTLGDSDRFYPGHGPAQDAIPMPPTAVAEA